MDGYADASRLRYRPSVRTLHFTARVRPFCFAFLAFRTSESVPCSTNIRHDGMIAERERHKDRQLLVQEAKKEKIPPWYEIEMGRKDLCAMFNGDRFA